MIVLPLLIGYYQSGASRETAHEMCVCVCVCVCERKRERERETD